MSNIHNYVLRELPSFNGLSGADSLAVSQNLEVIRLHLIADIARAIEISAWLPGAKKPKPAKGQNPVEQFAWELAHRLQMDWPDIKTLGDRLNHVMLAMRVGSAYFYEKSLTPEQAAANWKFANETLLERTRTICEYLAGMPMPKPAGRAKVQVSSGDFQLN